MFANSLRMSESTPFTSSLEEEVELTPRPQDQEPNPLSELLPETVLRSVELRTSPQSQPIPLEEVVVEENNGEDDAEEEDNEVDEGDDEEGGEDEGEDN